MFAKVTMRFMEISYIGHSSFRIKSKKTVIVTDPFDPAMVGLKNPKVEADIVTVSHDHHDHNFLGAVKNYRKVINGPGEYEVGGISIIGFPSYHDDKKGAERGKNTIYVFESEDIRLAHLGDLGHSLTDKNVEEMGDIDILMIPVGGFYTIGPSVAVDLVRKMQPEIVIPMHFGKSGLGESFKKLNPADDFVRELGMSVEKVNKLVVTAVDLEETEKVILFEDQK